MHRYLVDWRKRLAQTWLLLCGASLLLLGLHLLRVGRNWPLGDWLINYEGGFVRRGFMGEVLLQASRLTHVDPITFAMAICLACYLLVFLTLWGMTRRRSPPWWQLYALLSPATLTFPLLSTRAGFHKEVLLYAAVALLLWIYRDEKPLLSGQVVAAGLAAVCVVLLLSHEPLVFYLPYLYVVPVLALGSVRSALRVCAVSIMCSLLCFLLVLRHIGTPSTVAAICSSVRNGSEPCADPIGFLTMTRAGQLAMVQENIAQFHYFRIFPVLVLLSAIPFLLGVHALWQRRVARPLLVPTLVACAIASVGSITLFRFGPDWGRWVAMHAMCLLLLLLWIDRKSALPADTPAPAQRRSASLTLLPAAWAIGLVLYATCWSMPGFGDTPLHGFLGLLLHRP